MEKRTAHHTLATVRALCAEGNVMPTKTSLKTAAGLGMTRDDMVEVVQALTVAEFYKSMTSYGDHTQWQDVYHPSVEGRKLYLKLTITSGLLILSFKEL
ncbi:type II toxin-antitoxin system MqsR family toxin [Elstera sp.]|uniref:type II toxin-antitoxin system MqsR family toxin n=1 Tax=Elstera sp. TaxID=1916664 RepID=UPI0037BEEBCF